MEPNEHPDAEKGHGHGVEITIDHHHYRAPREEMTGAELRKLPDPDVPANRDLWLEVPHGDDERIDDAKVVHLRNGQKFYTAPKNINPGRK